MLSYNHTNTQSSNISHEFQQSNQCSSELSDSENAEINRSFSNLQVSPRGINESLGKIDEELSHPEHHNNKSLSKMGLVTNSLRKI